MYRAVELVDEDKDFHRFVWRSNAQDCLVDYRMTRVTFGVSASSFAANMAVKQNAIDHSLKYPEAAEVVHKSRYVDDCLTGAEDPKSALTLQQELTELFSLGGFILRKWNSNDPSVLQQIPPDLRDSRQIQVFSEADAYSKTLGIEWNVVTDQFHVSVSDVTRPTKRNITSDVAKVFDALGFLSPSTIKMKVLLQRLWEIKLEWDDPVPQAIEDVWNRWREELPYLTTLPIPRCYRPKEFPITSIQLHGFSDASEEAYAGVVYLRLESSDGKVHTALVISKTKVAPIKRLTIPRLELCGAHVLTKLLCHVRKTLDIPITSVFAWTDSTVVLSWLSGSPKRFKTYVGNRVSNILDQLPPERWRHVPGAQNPADCASRGLFPLELKDHPLWWNGPQWLLLEPSQWPTQSTFSESVPCEEKTACNLSVIQSAAPVVPLDRYSSFVRLKRVTAWILRFAKNARSSTRILSSHLTVSELAAAENYWLRHVQRDCFPSEVENLKSGSPLPRSSKLLPFRPFWDKDLSLICVGGRLVNSELSFSQSHPVILEGKHPVTKALIHSEHVRLMHAGPTLLQASLSQQFHIIGARKTVRFVTRECITCRRLSVKPQDQLLGQLPSERVSPAPPFDRTGVDYAGPFLIKYGYVRKPTTVKAYICLFVCLTTKAVHLELVSDLTAEAFIATFRRFLSRRGCPSLMWSDHGSNFVGAKGDLKDLSEFLASQVNQGAISEFCSSHKITWRFILEKSPHFGGIWESNVKSVKSHLKRIVSPVKLTFEEFTTVLTQVEAVLNSRPLTPTNSGMKITVDHRPKSCQIEGVAGHFL